MARIRATIVWSGVTTGTAAKTMAQVLAASNHRIALIAFGCFFKGTSATATPILVQILRQTDAGSGGTSYTLKADVPASETIQTTGLTGPTGATWTTEPTAGDILRDYDAHAQVGLEKSFGPDEELVAGGGGRLAVKVTADAAVNCDGYMTIEE